MTRQSISDRPRPRETTRSFWQAQVLVVILLAAPALFVLLAADAATHLSHPTDDELITRFYSHESSFNALTTRPGNVVVPVCEAGDCPAGATDFYLYLGDGEAEPLHARHSSGGWRGPGVYLVTGDRHIKGRWYIHHSQTMVVAFAPY